MKWNFVFRKKFALSKESSLYFTRKYADNIINTAEVFFMYKFSVTLIALRIYLLN